MFELAIVGAGVVGAAVAERLSRAGRSVVVLEQHARAGQVTSARNSQVLHSGLYYPAGSLKARLCVAGNRSLAEWCAARGVAWRRTGKLIVATAPGEEPQLAKLQAQGRANGVEGLELVDPGPLEPNVRASAALLVPSTGIVDAHGVVDSLVRAATARGVVFAFRHRVARVEPAARGFELQVSLPDGSSEVVQAQQVVNAAGLDADELVPGERQYWVKGCYFRVKSPRPLSRLVYPVPAPNLAGLGVHVTLGLDGDVRLGPDVHPLPARREDYDVPESLGDAFFESARRFLPWLERAQLSPDTAGIRPKLAPPGGPWRDFELVESSPGFLSLLGIESPGLTCCLELAAEVERRLSAR